MSCESPIKVNRFSGLSVPFTWTLPDNSAADLTGWAITVEERSTELVGLVTAAITTPAVGLVTITITWNVALVAGQEYYFRLALTKSGELPRSTDLITVVYQ